MTEEYSVSLTVTADPDRADGLVEFNLSDDSGDGTLQGTAQVDMDAVIEEAVEHAEVENTDAPSHIALAVQHAINES